MNTQITSKLAAVLVALMMNGLILGGVAFLFDASGAKENTASSLTAPAAAATDAPRHVV